MSMYAYADVSFPLERWNSGCRHWRQYYHLAAAASLSIRKVFDPKAAGPKVLDLKKITDARRLFELEQLEVNFEQEIGALWTFMRPRGRASYNPDLLEDFHAWQRGVRRVVVRWRSPQRA